MKVNKKNNRTLFKNLFSGDVFYYVHNPSIFYLVGYNEEGDYYQINLSDGKISEAAEDEPVVIVDGSFIEGE